MKKEEADAILGGKTPDVKKNDPKTATPAPTPIAGTKAKSMKEKYDELVAASKGRENKPTGIHATDVVKRVKEIFTEIKQPKLLLSAVREILASEEQFKDIKHQQVRSIAIKKHGFDIQKDQGRVYIVKS